MPDADTAAAAAGAGGPLAALLDRARAESTAAAWLDYADGLSATGQFANANDVRREIDEQLQDGPDRERLRLAQAGDYLNLGQPNVARRQFSYLADTATDSAVRAAAAGQVDRVRQHERDLAEYAQWQRLKAAAMQERIDTGPERYSDYCQRGQALVALLAAGDPAADYGTADQATSAAVAKYPESVELHEQRTVFLLRAPSGRQADLEAELTTLEGLAPDSPVLREFAVLGDEDLAEHGAQVWDRIRSLLALVMGPATGARAAAVEDFRLLAAEFPGNLEVGSAFAAALAVTGHSREAIEQAEQVAPRAGASSELHLTLGQAFWHAGDHARGREHLALAAEYAATDADRDDVAALRSSLGA